MYGFPSQPYSRWSLNFSSVKEKKVYAPPSQPSSPWSLDFCVKENWSPNFSSVKGKKGIRSSFSAFSPPWSLDFCVKRKKGYSDRGKKYKRNLIVSLPVSHEKEISWWCSAIFGLLAFIVACHQHVLGESNSSNLPHSLSNYSQFQSSKHGGIDVR